MEMIYDWLYAHYYQPHEEEILRTGAEREAVAAAEGLLLLGEGSDIDRQDALRTLQRVGGTAAFAAGVYFGRRLTADLACVAPVCLGGMTLVL